MRLAGILLSYVLAIGFLFAGLVGGVTWLIQPGAAVSGEPRVAPIPPRIADSIERRKPLPVRAEEPESVKPVMKEVNVSLAPPPAGSFKIRELSPPAKQQRTRRDERGVASDQAVPAVPVPAPVVSTARSDFPY